MRSFHHAARSRQSGGKPTLLSQMLVCAAVVTSPIALSLRDDFQLARAVQKYEATQTARLREMDHNPLAYAIYSEDKTQRSGAPRLVDLSLNRGQVNDINVQSLARNQLTLLRNKIEMDAAFVHCDNAPTTCPPSLVAYRSMIGVVRQIADPLTQAGVVNAWVNNAIQYDNVEAKQASWRRTLTDTLAAGQGVCDEQGQLKLYALDKAGFKPENLRFVLAAMVQNGKRVGAHAFVLTRIGSNNWVLDNQQLALPVAGKKLPATEEQRVFGVHAQLIPDMVHANLEGKNLPVIGTREIVPTQAFHYYAMSRYEGVANTEQAPFYVGSPQKLKKKSHGAAQEFELSKALATLPPAKQEAIKASLETALYAYRPVSPPQIAGAPKLKPATP